MARLLFLCLILLTLTACGGEAVVESTDSALPVLATEMPVTEPLAAEAPTAAATEPEPEHFLLTFAGDCTFGSSPANYYAGYGFIKTVGEDYRYPFRNVLSYFDNDDFTMVNLEGPLCDAGNPVVKKHTFRGPTAYTAILTENSVEAVTLANNHTMDYGQKGYDSTLSALNALDLPFVEHQGTCLVTTDSGLNIGLYAMTYADLDAEKMAAGITQLKKQGAEVIVVAAHWGVEGTYHESRQQQELGHLAIDAGAHIVFGSHPHVLQPIESYNGGIIYYSLGNFSFGGNGYPRDLDTALLQQEVIRYPDGSVELGKLTRIPASCSSVAGRNNFQPTPYEPGTEDYDRVISKLDGSFQGPNLKIG